MTEMTKTASSETPVPFQWLRPENVAAALKGAPLKVQAALRAAAHLNSNSSQYVTFTVNVSVYLPLGYINVVGSTRNRN